MSILFGPRRADDPSRNLAGRRFPARSTDACSARSGATDSGGRHQRRRRRRRRGTGTHTATTATSSCSMRERLHLPHLDSEWHSTIPPRPRDPPVGDGALDCNTLLDPDYYARAVVTISVGQLHGRGAICSGSIKSRFFLQFSSTCFSWDRSSISWKSLW